MSLLRRWSTNGSGGGVTHISCHYKNTIEGTGENKTNEQTLGVNSRAKRWVMQHYISDSIYGLTLAWITSENSTKLLECRHLDSIFFAGPYPLCYCVRSQPPLSVSCRPLLVSSFLQPTLFSRPVTSSGHAEISSPKTLCLVSRQNRQESSAWRATHIVLQYPIGYQSAQFFRRALHYASGGRQFLRQRPQPPWGSIYCHPQTDSFVLSELFSVARHAGRAKPGSKPIQLYVRLCFRPLVHQRCSFYQQFGGFVFVASQMIAYALILTDEKGWNYLEKTPCEKEDPRR